MRSVSYALAIVLLQLQGTAFSQTSTDGVAEGRRAYMAAGCYQCHGTAGHGGVGPKLAPAPMPVEAMTAFVRNASRAMPAYGPEVLSDADLRRIHTYLQSIAASPTPAQIPQLQ